MAGERDVVYHGYDFGKDLKVRRVIAAFDNVERPGTLRSLAGKALRFEGDDDGHCIARGLITSELDDLQSCEAGAAVIVAIYAPKVGVETTREFVRKVANHLHRDRVVYRPYGHRLRRGGGERGNVIIFILPIIPVGVARALLLKIADRMIERRGRYALAPVPNIEGRVA